MAEDRVENRNRIADNNRPIQQASEDPALLKLMMEDMRSAPALYKPGNYWKHYEDLFMPELLTMGLHDFRRRRNTVLRSFNATDESPSLVGFYSRPYGNRARALNLRELLRRIVFSISPLSRSLRDTAAFTGLTLEGTHRL